MSVNCEVKNMNKSVRSWKMKIRKVGNISPPEGYSNGRYGGLKKFANLTISRLNGKAILIRSLGSVGRMKGNWCNYPTGSPYQTLGTLQSQLSFWKGQKREPGGLCL